MNRIQKNTFCNFFPCLLALMAGFVSPIGAQYPTAIGCPNVTNTDFDLEILVSRQNHSSLMEPLRLSFAPDDQGNPHFYFIERRGKVKYYNAVTTAVTEVGDFRISQVMADIGNLEHGLLGIAVDPNFKTNRWIYFQHAVSAGSSWLLSRFTLASNNTLNMSSQVVLMTIPHNRSAHTGGDLVFDKHGNLLLTIGEQHLPDCFEPRCYHSTTNSAYADEDGPPNTRSFLGGIVRIHPENNGTYTIPSGNFGEFFADYFQRGGNSTLANQYRDTALVRPELYVKGFRNPYTISYDSVRDWATVSDCGSECRNYSGLDATKPWCPINANGEEHNIVKEPGFFGWPYFHGLNHPYAQTASVAKSVTAPTNVSPFNTGVQTLPPAIPATHAYPQSCAMTGPIYRYNGNLVSNVKLPPHFDGKWFVTDFNSPSQGSWIKLISLDNNGMNTNVSTNIFTHLQGAGRIIKPLHLYQGPDGAIYIISYSSGVWIDADASTSISRIVYNGNCRPTGINSNTAKGKLSLTNGILNIENPGSHTVSIYDTRGGLVQKITGNGKVKYDLRQGILKGLYIVEVETEEENFKRKLAVLN